MHFSAPLLALLTLTSTTIASSRRPARQYRRELSPETSNNLIPRLDLDPTIVCGENYVDCNNGWCCSEGATCENTSAVPFCKDPTESFLGGTKLAHPFKSIENIASSLIVGVYSSLTAELSLPTGTTTRATTAKITGSATGSATGTGAAAWNTGAAARLGAWGAAGVIGGAVMMVV